MMVEMNGWESRQIDYVLAFYQAPLDSDVYIYLPSSFHVYGEDKNETYFLNVKKVYMELVKQKQIGLI